MGWKSWVCLGLTALLLAWFGFYLYVPYNVPEIEPRTGEPGFESGPVVHILPTVNHRRMLLKTSFERPFERPPRLRVNDRHVEGMRTDSRGRFWSFDVPDLQPSTTYELSLRTSDGDTLTDPWSLKTYPAPDSEPDHVRLAVFTCPGGHPAHRWWFGLEPVSLEARRAMVKRMLAFDPDAMVSLGDQIYFDQHHGLSATVMGQSRQSRAYAGNFDRTKPVLGTENEKVLRRAVGPQVSHLYGVKARSTPSFFLLDDHDYFENDVAMEADYGFDWRLLLFGWRSPWYRGGVSFPADDFMLTLARTYQHMYLPEFLPDSNRPRDLPGGGAPDRPSGISETYGTLRYGQLLEGLLYEGRRYVTLDGKEATLVHPAAEKWLKRRLRGEETHHVVNLTALPFGWADGSWMEWYPDVRGEAGELTTARDKHRWQSGWFEQHNRILAAAGSMEHTRPLFIGGDHHDQAAGRILGSGHRDFTDTPVTSLLTGALGGMRLKNTWLADTEIVRPPDRLHVEEAFRPTDKNGFLIVDFTPDRVKVRFFRWSHPEPVERIETMEPHRVMTLPVPQGE